MLTELFQAHAVTSTKEALGFEGSCLPLPWCSSALFERNLMPPFARRPHSAERLVAVLCDALMKGRRGWEMI